VLLIVNCVTVLLYACAPAQMPRETTNNDTAMAPGAPQQCGPFNSNQRILLVGEGDLSFALSLARKFGDGRRITATTLNSQEYVETHCANGRANIAELQGLGATVIHDVDATRIDRSAVADCASTDAVIFNFPHPGWLDERGSWQGHGNLLARHRQLDTHLEP
jgi:25S rRNA (uracil2634-N3)-methyltransferase